MKGGFYGLRAKQLILFLAAVAFTVIIFFGWAKTPIIFSVVPPQSHVLKIPPGEVKEKQVPEGENASEGVSASVPIVAPVSSTSTSAFMSETEKKNSTTLRGTSEETTKKDKEVSVIKQVSEGEKNSKHAVHVSVAPVKLVPGRENLKTQETTKKDKEVSVIKQVSEGEKNSKHAVHVSVAPVKLVPGRENLKTQETTKKDKEVSVIKQVSEGEKNSKHAVHVSVAPVKLVPGRENLKTQETTKKDKEVSVIKQVSEGEKNSKHAVHVSVAPVKLVPGRENLKTQACNYAKGKWITDDNRPLYSGFGCKQWLSSMWACRLTQRTDFEYEKLRWQPKDCEMEDFTGSKFLRRMQNKTLAFIGDSLGRQQFQSLMCMVTGGEERPDILDVGKEYGLVKARGQVRPDGWAYRFPRTNTTILYYWSASLCDLEPLDITNSVTDFAMHLDRPPAFLRNFLHKFDVLVLNTGHHWNRGKLNANRWVMHVGGKPNTNRKIADIAGAKNFTIYSIVNWVNSEFPKYPRLKAFYRSISPRHFFNGDWNTGGTCDNTTPRSGELEVLHDESIDPQAAGSVKGTRVKLLDITALSQLRDKGHISRYSLKSTPGMQDCLHWCLPGVPDTWNELLFAQL